jgi:hypothetical protein
MKIELKIGDLGKLAACKRSQSRQIVNHHSICETIGKTLKNAHTAGNRGVSWEISS